MYTLEIPLKYNGLDEKILSKRFRIGERIYNTVLNEFQGRLNCYKQSKKYRKLIVQPKSKSRTEELIKLQKEFNLDQSSYDKYCSILQKHYKMHFDSQCVQKIGIHVKKSIDDLMYNKSHSVHYKKINTLMSVEGKTYTTGIKFNFEKFQIEWLGLELPIKIRKDNTYIETGLALTQKGCEDKAKWEINNAKFDESGKKIRVPKKFKPEFGELCYVRIVRKFIKNKFKYCVQLIINSCPPNKNNVTKTEGDVGFDLGISTVAIVSEQKTTLKPICDLEHLKHFEKIKLYLQRKLDRQRRLNNPENFNSDGTIKHGIKLTWFKSKNYFRTLCKLKDIHRKIAISRKEQQNILANEILSMGNRINVENMSILSMSRKTKIAKINSETGRFKSRKRFGRIILNYAPSQLLTIIKNKAVFHDIEVIEISTKKIKASQYNHVEDKYIEKKLSTRWNVFNIEDKLIKIQRDLYSGYLLMNVEDDCINKDKCHRLFKSFIKLHDEEINILKLSNKRYPSAMGI